MLHAVSMDVCFYEAQVETPNEIIVGSEFIAPVTDKGEPLAEKKIFFSKNRKTDYLDVWVQTHTKLVKRAGLLNIDSRFFAEEGNPSNVKEVLPSTKLGKALEAYINENGRDLNKFLFEEV